MNTVYRNEGTRVPECKVWRLYIGMKGLEFQNVKYEDCIRMKGLEFQNVKYEDCIRMKGLESPRIWINQSN